MFHPPSNKKRDSWGRPSLCHVTDLTGKEAEGTGDKSEEPTGKTGANSQSATLERIKGPGRGDVNTFGQPTQALDFLGPYDMPCEIESPS